MLPNYYLITDDNAFNKKAFLARLELHLQNGIQLIQLRCKRLALNDYIDLASTCLELANNFKANILLNVSLDNINCFPIGTGLHIRSHELVKLDNRPVGKETLISAACHNEDELKHAETIGVDFVTLSPVLPTQTHPEAKPLGWDNFQRLCGLVNIPVFALGGLSERQLEQSFYHGGVGIAAISSLWNKIY